MSIEVLAYCEKCRAITPHRMREEYYDGEGDTVIKLVTWKCLNCGKVTEEESVESL